MSIDSFARLRTRVAEWVLLFAGLLVLVPAPAGAAVAGAPAAGEAATGSPGEAPAEVPPARWTRVSPPGHPRPSNDALGRTLAEHRGRPVLVHFWASWCQPCREELPDLQRAAASEDIRGLAVVTVAVADRPRDVDALLREIGVDLPVVHDPDQAISRAYGAFGVPTSLLLDRRHRVRWRAVGMVDWAGEPTRAAVAKVMSPGRRPAPR